MSEFLFPTYGEWLKEHRAWPWKGYDTDRWNPTTIFVHVSSLVRELLSLPSQRDYYRPERASLVLGTLYEQPEAVTHGAVSFAAWMVREKNNHLPTSLMGAEICRGMRRLQEGLKIPDLVSNAINDLLKESGYEYDSVPSAHQIVAEWLNMTEPKIPLASWLRGEARSDEYGESTGISQNVR